MTAGMPWPLAVILALISAIPGWYAMYSAIAAKMESRPPPVSAVGKGWRFWLAVVCPILAWGAVGWDYYDRQTAPADIHAVALAWGAGSQAPNMPPFYTLQLDTKPIIQFADTHKAILIVRNASWPIVDPLNDPIIEKSVAYTISGPVIQFSFQGAGKIRFGASVPNQVEFTIALIPNDISPDQIMKIADIKKLGGIIVSAAGQMIVGGAAAGSPAPVQQPAQPAPAPR